MATIPGKYDWSSQSVVLSPGGEGTWDHYFKGCPTPCHALYFDGQYFLYYSASEDMQIQWPPDDYEGVHKAIGVATSTNLTTWTKYSGNPIIEYNPGGSDHLWEGAWGGCAIAVGSTVHFFYGAHLQTHSPSYNSVDIGVRHRTSTNGKDFTGDELLYYVTGEEWSPVAVMYEDSVFHVYVLNNPSGGSTNFNLWRFIYTPGSPPTFVKQELLFTNYCWLMTGFVNVDSETRALIYWPSLTTGSNEVRTINPATPGTISGVVETYDVWTNAPHPDSPYDGPMLLLDNSGGWHLFNQTGNIYQRVNSAGTVLAVPATATTDMVSPTVTGGASSSTTVYAVPATASTDMKSPTVTAGASSDTTVYAVPASASTDMKSPVIYTIPEIDEEILLGSGRGGVTANYEVWLDDPRGNRIALLDGLTWISFIKAANSAGGFSIGLAYDFDESLVHLDSLVEIWRRAEGGTLRLAFVGFVRQWYYEGTEAGDALTISGQGVNELLARRIVAYAAGSAYADKTDHAGDMMKAVVRENLGSSATDTDRDLSSLGLTVAADLGDGASITKAFAYKPVLEALQGIAEASRTAGTEVYFDLAPGFDGSGLLTLAFTTYTGQIGQDRRASANTPVYFGPQWGNLGSPALELDYTEEITVAYAGGQGEGADRVTDEVEDATRSGASAWGRREGFADARNDSSTAGVTAAAQELLAEKRPKLKFSGSLLDSEQFRYGIDWDFGDRVTCEYRGMQFDGMISLVQLSVDEAGVETLDVRIEVEE